MGENTIRIGQCSARADDVAQVLGKTGTLLGRVIARVRLSYAMGHLVDRESLGKKISQISQSDLAVVTSVFDKTVAHVNEETPQIQEVRNRVLFGEHAQDELQKCLNNSIFASGPFNFKLDFTFNSKPLTVFFGYIGQKGSTRRQSAISLRSEGLLISLYKNDRGERVIEKDGTILEGKDATKLLTEYSPHFAAALAAVKEKAESSAT